MGTENINLQFKNIFNCFGQNTAEFYHKHILNRALYIGKNLGWNHTFLALHLKRKTEFFLFKHCPPPLDTRSY